MLEILVRLEYGKDDGRDEGHYDGTEDGFVFGTNNGFLSFLSMKLTHYLML